MEKARSPDRHIAAARQRLSHLQGIAGRTAAAERRILDLAEKRHAEVLADLARLRPRVNLDPDAAEQYQRLTMERGQLDMVTARARQLGAA
ncbi:MAG: hypothetical protein E7K72_19305 [Roseomonas mucosa]|nr:hypothetical protein [Roseomonas mucosa]